MLSHSEEEEQEDNDNSHKLEKAGVNVHAGIGDQVVSDHSVPVEKIVREAKKAEGQDVKTFITDAQVRFIIEFFASGLP